MEIKRNIYIVGILLSLLMTACEGQRFQVSDSTVTELTQNTPLEGDVKIEQIDQQTQDVLDSMEKVVAETQATTEIDESVLDKLNATNSVLKIRKILKDSVSKLGDSISSASVKVAEAKKKIQDKIDALDPSMPGYDKAKKHLEALVEKLDRLEFKLDEVADKIRVKLESVAEKLDRLLEKIASRLTRWDITGISTMILEKQLIKYKNKIFDKLIDRLLNI